MRSSTRAFASTSAPRAAAAADWVARRRRNHLSRTIGRLGTNGITGMAILSGLVLIAVLGPVVSASPVQMNVPQRLQPPTAAHLMGTDEFGRDILTRVLHGARISLATGVGVVVIGLGVGVALGVTAGYYGGTVSLALMGMVDLMLALPGVLLAIVIAALLTPALGTAILAVGIVNIPYYARLVWGAAQTTRILQYVEAAKAAGASDARIIVRHIVPGIVPPALVQATLGIGNGVLTVSALSFLGVGAQPPTPEWGLMLSEAQRFLLNAPYMGIFPGLGIMFTVLSFNLVGDAMRDLLDPVLARTLGR
jgi:peptide/nickel transport system permease protein